MFYVDRRRFVAYNDVCGFSIHTAGVTGSIPVPPTNQLNTSNPLSFWLGGFFVFSSGILSLKMAIKKQSTVKVSNRA